MANENNSNSNSNFFGFQRDVSQTVTNSSSNLADQAYLQEALKVAVAIEAMKDGLGLSETEKTMLEREIATLKVQASAGSTERNALRKTLSTILDICKSAAGSAIGAGVVAMIRSLI